MPKKKVPTMKESNESLVKLAVDLNKAIFDYENRGIVNFVTVVGILDDLKLGLLTAQRQNFEDYRERVKDMPSYIG